MIGHEARRARALRQRDSTWSSSELEEPSVRAQMEEASERAQLEAELAAEREEELKGEAAAASPPSTGGHRSTAWPDPIARAGV